MTGGKKSRHDLTDHSTGVSFKTKRESVKRWLTLALAPHADLQVKLPLARDCDGLAKVLELTVARIIADKKLVHQIWQLKKCQS